MTSPTVEETPLRTDHDGDHERFAHYAKKADITRAAVTGELITALCGKKFTPSRDPDRYPVCPTCVEVRGRMAGA